MLSNGRLDGFRSGSPISFAMSSAWSSICSVVWHDMPRLTTAAFRPTSDMIPLAPPARVLLTDRRLHDLVGVLHRLALLDRVDVLHAFGHFAPHGVLFVEETG